jgi:hypothetical protein
VLVARWDGPLRDEDVATALSRAAMPVLGSVAPTARQPGGVVLVVPRPDLVGDRAM